MNKMKLSNVEDRIIGFRMRHDDSVECAQELAWPGHRVAGAGVGYRQNCLGNKKKHLNGNYTLDLVFSLENRIFPL